MTDSRKTQHATRKKIKKNASYDAAAKIINLKIYDEPASIDAAGSV